MTSQTLIKPHDVALLEIPPSLQSLFGKERNSFSLQEHVEIEKEGNKKKNPMNQNRIVISVDGILMAESNLKLINHKTHMSVYVLIEDTICKTCI